MLEANVSYCFALWPEGVASPGVAFATGSRTVPTVRTRSTAPAWIGARTAVGAAGAA